jgi:hypothetical protein
MYESGDDEYPDTDSEEFILRKALLNAVIMSWANKVFQGVPLKELYKTVEGLESGASGDIYIELADFMKAERLYVNDQEYQLVGHAKGVKMNQENSSEKVFWVVGSGNSYKVYANPTLTATDDVKFSYYRKPTLVTASNTDEYIEMAAPYYAVYSVLAQMYLKDGDVEQYNVINSEALNLMDEMVNGAGLLSELYGDVRVDETDLGFGT